MNKNKHKSGTHICNSPNIMIKSGKVHLDISRLYSEVEIKNLFHFCYKNHYGRNNINKRYNIITDLLHYFVQMFVQSLHMELLTTYPEISPS
jgi:hypothetical protein